jgi:hypothetical protein
MNDSFLGDENFTDDKNNSMIIILYIHLPKKFVVGWFLFDVMLPLSVLCMTEMGSVRSRSNKREPVPFTSGILIHD